MSYTEIKAIKGLRNDVTPERFAVGDLAIANNIDIDETGKCSSRLGTAVLYAGAAHSAWSDGTQAFFVQGGNLNWFLPNTPPTPIAAVTGPRVSYTNINGAVYWSDTTTSGVVINGVNKPWGKVVPSKLLPTAVAGNMPAGTYLCTMTYVDAAGAESGAPASAAITLSSGNSPGYDYPLVGGILISNLSVSSDPTVTTKNIYVSAPNGELPLLMANIPNAQTSVEFTAMSAQGIPVRTQFLGPPPPGQAVNYYNGMALVASGNFLWYSLPYEFELFDQRTGFIPFSPPIQTISPVVDGIYVGTTTNTMFLAGMEPAQFMSRQVSTLGSVLGTEVTVPSDAIGMAAIEGSQGEGRTVLWTSTRGIVIGTDGGLVRDVTVSRYVLPPGLTQGCALLKYRYKTPQYVVSLSQ